LCLPQMVSWSDKNFTLLRTQGLIEFHRILQYNPVWQRICYRQSLPLP
jgi:hypothetical protein